MHSRLFCVEASYKSRWIGFSGKCQSGFGPMGNICAFGALLNIALRTTRSTLECRHGSSNNRNNQERTLYRDRRSRVDRCGWEQIPSRKTDGALPVRRIDRETVLRRHTFQNRFSSRRASRAGIEGITFCHSERSRLPRRNFMRRLGGISNREI